MTAAAPQLAGRREWIGLAVLALARLLYAMDLTVLHLAVPSLSADLHPSSSELLWITDIYGFMVAGFLITAGALGDRIGRRRLLLPGAAAFGVLSVFAALSTSPQMLITTRALPWRASPGRPAGVLHRHRLQRAGIRLIRRRDPGLRVW